MIVTSKLCFLNIMTQLCSANDLVNANYFIADAREQERVVPNNTNLQYDTESEQYVPNNSKRSSTPTMSQYLIHYCDLELDPQTSVQEAVAQNPNIYIDDSNKMDIFKAYLLKESTLLSIYQNYFKEELDGNGLQVVIFNSESILADYGNLICGYLAEIFGVDVNFIDPQFLPIKGQSFYQGNKKDGESNIKKIKDYELLIGLRGAITQTENFHSLSNLDTWLRGHAEITELIYIYNLAFPNNPLPPGEYTYEQLIDILTMACARTFIDPSKMSNDETVYDKDQLYTSQEYIDALSEYQEMINEEYEAGYDMSSDYYQGTFE